MKPLLVGECNPYQRNEEDAMRCAFHPDPHYASGGRLCHDIMQLTEREYLRRFDRTDLCWPKWSLAEARLKATRLVAERTSSDLILAFGAKVASAFNLAYTPMQTRRALSVSAPLILILPHPSGRNRFWQTKGAIERVRDALMDAGVLPRPSSSADKG